MIRLPRSVPETAAELSQGFAGGQAIRLINYHSTPRRREAEYRRQLRACAGSHAGLDGDGLARLMAGERVSDRPLLVPVLFEGFRDNIDVILPIIEACGFTAWFFIPPAFLTVPVAHQRGFAERQTLIYPHDDYPGERISMTWDEARAAHRRGHLMACHSRTHTELTPETSDDVLHDEIVLAKHEFEAGLGAEVEMFCYLRGAEWGLNPRADAMLAGAGYRYLFSNFRLQKIA